MSIVYKGISIKREFRKNHHDEIMECLLCKCGNKEMVEFPFRGNYRASLGMLKCRIDNFKVDK